MDGALRRPVRPSVILALARAHWTLSLRLPQGTVTEKVITWGFVGPILAVVAWACSWLGFRATTQMAEEPSYLHLILMGVGGFILLMYLVVVPTTRSLSGFDLAKLFHLPLRPGEILASLLLGNALNPTAILLPAAFFAGCVAGSLATGHVLLGLACLCGGVLWLVQFALILTGLDFLLLWLGRSRWLNRILLAVLLLMIVPGGALLTASSESDAAPLWHTLVHWLKEAAPVLAYVPGLSPLAWVGDQGAWWAVLAVALLETAVLYGVGACLLARLMTGGAVEEHDRSSGWITSMAPWMGRARRRILRSLLAKDFRILWREKSFKVILFGVSVMMGSLSRVASGSETDPGLDLLGHSLPFLAVGLLGAFGFNALAYEGPGLVLLLGSPAPRWRVLWSKNMALLGFMLAVMGLGEGILLAQGTRGIVLLRDCTVAATMSLLYVGGGNISSVLWPFPASLSGKAAGGKMAPARIFLVSVAQFVVTLLVFVVSVPLLSGWYALSAFEHAGPLFWTLAAFMAAYSVTTYVLLLAWAGRLMGAREPEIFERLVRQAG